MENEIPIEFRKFFLLSFTKELIRHSAKQDIIRLQSIIEWEERGELKKVSKINIEPVSFPKESNLNFANGFSKPKTFSSNPVPIQKKQSIIIPEPKLPANMKYLKPVPSVIPEIDLFKLNPLIKDISVKAIEASPDEKVIVRNENGEKTTQIVLTEEEIDKIIDQFSKISKIPVTEGIYRVIVDDLTLSAINSNLVGSRFIIKKTIASPNQLPQSQSPFYAKEY
jgi:hypothetical protein